MADSNSTALGLLKSSLGFYGADLDPSVESYLSELLEYAETALRKQCGIVLDSGDVYDNQLQAMYAGWLYRKAKEGTAKPEMLKTAIRDRQVENALSST